MLPLLRQGIQHALDHLAAAAYRLCIIILFARSIVAHDMLTSRQYLATEHSSRFFCHLYEEKISLKSMIISAALPMNRLILFMSKH